MSPTNNGWPDAEKPGVPLNPEKSGAHTLSSGIWLWYSGPDQEGSHWIDDAGRRLSPGTASRARYEGPCLTPDHHAAAIASARRETVEACALRAEKLADQGMDNGSWDDGISAWDAAQIIASNLRNDRPIPSTSPLDALLSQAEATGCARAFAAVRQEADTKHVRWKVAIRAAVNSAQAALLNSSLDALLAAERARGREEGLKEAAAACEALDGMLVGTMHLSSNQYECAEAILALLNPSRDGGENG